MTRLVAALTLTACVADAPEPPDCDATAVPVDPALDLGGFSADSVWDASSGTFTGTFESAARVPYDATVWITPVDGDALTWEVDVDGVCAPVVAVPVDLDVEIPCTVDGLASAWIEARGPDRAGFAPIKLATTRNVLPRPGFLGSLQLEGARTGEHWTLGLAWTRPDQEAPAGTFALQRDDDVAP